MNKYTQYTGYFLTGWTFLQLVGFLYNAFPVTRMLGNILVIFIVLGSLGMGVIEMIKSSKNHTSNYGVSQGQKVLLAFLPSLLIMIVLFIPLLVGGYIAG